MMRKINALLNNTADSQFNHLAKQADARLNLQQFWAAAAPKMLSQHSFAGSLAKGQLCIFAHNASVAAKIKLTSANLLSQLHILQESDPFYRDYKVTAIVVKVQVISPPKTSVKTPRKLSKQASSSLKSLAEELGDSPLSSMLKQLAGRQ